jgi:DNA polymerase-3 subunit delta'
MRISGEEMTFAGKFGPFINNHNALDMLDEFQQAYRDIRGNINARLVFFDLSVKMHKLLRRKAAS